VQTCIVHMIRHSLNYVPWNDRKQVAADLKTIYRAESADAAALRLDEIEEKWDGKYPPIGQSWRRNWEQVIPFFAYPEAVHKIIYTTNAIESLNMSLRKMIKNRGTFPATTRPPSCSTWPCETPLKSGPCHQEFGNRH
jgi:putative transposase